MNRNISCRLFLLLLTSLAQPPLFGYITVSAGNVSGTWTTGNTYYLSGTITVQLNTTLTIEPGVVVKFSGSTEMIIYGTLNASGAAENKIIFTSRNDNTCGEIISGSSGTPEKGDYYGIYLNGSGSYVGNGSFTYCVIRYGGNTSTSYRANLYFYKTDGGSFNNSTCEFSAGYGAAIYSTYPTISNSTFRSNSYYGLYVNGDYLDGTAPTIVNNAFENNTQHAAYITNANLTSYAGNTGTGNGINGFGVAGEIRAARTWSSGSATFPFVLVGMVTVLDNQSLTIAEGTIIKSENGEMTVYGTLDINGTAGNNVIFTSLRDDIYGGDTNRDSNATSPSAGDWRGIQIIGSSNPTTGYDGYGYFDYCRLRYGGNTSTSFDANLYFNRNEWNGSYFVNSVSEYSQGYGLSIYNASPTVTNDTIRQNSLHGIYASTGYQPTTGPTICNNLFVQNTQYAAYLSNIRLTSYSGNTGWGNGTNAIGVYGNVTENRTWTAGSAAFPFVLINTVTINDGCILTLNPGTVIKATNLGEIVAYGTLNSAGNSDSAIVFTSLQDDEYGGDTQGDGNATLPSRGDWRGINLSGSGNPSTGNDGYGHFDYTRVRYAGNTGTDYDANVYFNRGEWNGCYFRNSISEYSAYYGIRIYNSSPSISGSTIANCSQHGVYASTGYIPSTSPSFTNNVFTGNASYAAFMDNIRLSGYSGNRGSGNAVNGFGMSGSVQDNIAISAGTAAFPFVLHSQVTVEDGKVLTVAPGTIIKCAPYGTIVSYGTLEAVAADSQKIIITSLKDDSYGGDSNGDGTATSPAPGDWIGIQLVGSSNPSSGNDGYGHFDFCIVRYGGNLANSSYDANIYFTTGQWNGNYFTNGSCEYSAGYGIHIYDESPTIRYCGIANNASHGIYAHTSYLPTTSPSIKDNMFDNNLGHGVYLVSVRINSYTGNSGSGNAANQLSVSGTVMETQSWFSGSGQFPVALIGDVTVNASVVLYISGGTARCGTYTVNGSGNFYVGTNATLEIGSPNGISSSGSSGNVTVTGIRTFLTTANYVYNGTAPQITGSGLPGTVNDLTVNNSAGVTLSAPVAVGGKLYISAGTLQNSPNNISMSDSATITRKTGSLAGPPLFGTKINLEYSGETGVTVSNEMPLTDIIQNFTVNNPGGVTLNRTLRVNNQLQFISGKLITGTDTVIVPVSGSVSGESNTSYISGNVAARKYVGRSQSAAGGIGVEFNEGADSLGLVTLFRASGEGAAVSRSGRAGINRRWTITSEFPPVNGRTVQLTWAGDDDNVSKLNSMQIWKSTDNGLDWFRIGNTHNCAAVRSVTFTANSFSRFTVCDDTSAVGAKLLHLTARLQGMYNPVTDVSVCDTLTVFLASPNTPYAVLDTARGCLDTNGALLLEFSRVPNQQNYFYVITHRNAIETWSAAANPFVNFQSDYDFSSAQNKAFGGNLIVKGTRWCIYNGDVNQDGIVDFSDLAAVDNDSYNFAGGYISTDLTGDQFVDYSDLSLCDNNSLNFICAVKP